MVMASKMTLSLTFKPQRSIRTLTVRFTSSSDGEKRIDDIDRKHCVLCANDVRRDATPKPLSARCESRASLLACATSARAFAFEPSSRVRVCLSMLVVTVVVVVVVVRCFGAAADSCCCRCCCCWYCVCVLTPRSVRTSQHNQSCRSSRTERILLVVYE